MIFGAEEIAGQLPVFLNETWKTRGEIISNLSRLKYYNTGAYSMDFTPLLKIDSVVLSAIRNKEMPGCQILMVHKM